MNPKTAFILCLISALVAIALGFCGLFSGHPKLLAQGFQLAGAIALITLVFAFIKRTEIFYE